MTLGGGGQLFAANRLAKALDSIFDLYFVTAPDSRSGIDPAFRDRIFYNPSLQKKSNPSRLRTARLTVVAIARSFYCVYKYRPHAIIGVQGASALPLMIAGSVFRVRRIYIETFTRTKVLSLTARLLLRFHLVDRVYVQWPDLVTGDKRIVYRGTVL